MPKPRHPLLASSQNFFALLRDVEEQFPTARALGESSRLSEDPVRLGQRPHLRFATEDAWVLQSDQAIQGAKLYVQNFGLLGPQGALPLHFSEHAYNRIHHHGDSTFAEFLDVFHHRAYTLFYRAWANPQPHVGFRRPLHNPFARQLSALTGLGARTCWGREALPVTHRLGLAAHYTRHSRSAESLQVVVESLTGLRCEVRQFQGQWLQVQNHERGKPALGRGLMLGQRVWDAQSRVVLNIGPMSLAAYLNLQPGTEGRRMLAECCHAHLGLEFDCDVLCQLNAAEVPQLRLGRQEVAQPLGRLGRTAWLGRWKKQEPATAPLRRQAPFLSQPCTEMP